MEQEHASIVPHLPQSQNSHNHCMKNHSLHPARNVRAVSGHALDPVRGDHNEKADNFN